MDGLLHLLNLAGRTIAAMESRIEALEAENAALRAAMAPPEPKP